ncbi:MAG: FecR domain-containing protein [Bacteroidales bacterium]|jgi:ferric-dicitrate binding protein FerR (iron transport regulator)|nr:FecR domain-containing protein [Bacteroidales bacterium]
MIKDDLQNDEKIIHTFREGAVDKFPEDEKRLLRQRIHKSIEGKRNNSFVHIYLWAAAAIVILFGIGYMLNNLAGRTKPVQMISHETGNEERMRVLLPDSTVVLLNAGSRIEYPVVFDDKSREVKLSGEAYFDVKPQKEQPFVVLTGQLQINVLGTQFTVSDYQDATTAETVLISGKVNVRSANDSVSVTNLVPDEQFLFNKENQDIVIQKIDASRYTTWVNGRLHFDNAELGYIINRLERWYGKKIECPEDLKTSYRLTFTVRNEDISQIFQLIQNALPVQFEQTEDKIMIHQKNN